MQKKSEGTTYNYSDENLNVDIGEFKVIDDKYYYVYTTYENSDGLYRDFDDVAVVMGYAGMLVNDVKWESSYNDIDPVWENFAKRIINNEVSKSLQESRNAKIEFDVNELIITIAAESVENNYIVKFSYEDGIVSYIPNKDKSNEQLILDSKWQAIVIDEFIEKFEYDKEEFYKHLESKEELSLAIDGIEFNFKNIDTKEENKSDGYMENLSLDIINGLKTFKEKIEDTKDDDIDETEKDQPLKEEPKTGIVINISSILLILIVSYVIYNNYKNKNKLTRL